MEFDAAGKLAKASGRAKSDVANKLVSMALSAASRKIALPSAVRSPDYQQAVRDAFHNCCPYCGTALERGNTILEHLDAMNRYRGGLHVPGNLLPACKACNQEKRRDDQAKDLPPEVSGWERFLQHDGSHGPECKTCAYWVAKWPDPAMRAAKLKASRRQVAAFRDKNLPQQAKNLSPILASRLQAMYKAAQGYALNQTKALVQSLSEG